MRVPSARPNAKGMGGWIHPLKERRASPPPRPEPPRPPVEILDRAYTLLLGLLPLAARHRMNLMQRGLAAEDIRRNGYRTLPPVTGHVARAWWERCEGIGIDPARIPGMITVRDKRRRIAGWPGILIPVRDLNRRIQGFQVRADDPEVAGTKYFWLSSASKGGSSPGAPAHLALPETLASSCDVIVTEGPLKADIAASFLEIPIIGVAGVGNWRPALEFLRTMWPRRVIIAYDADGAENPTVRDQEQVFGRALKQEGMTVKLLRWDRAKGKGIDDLLLGGGRIDWR